MKAFSGDQKKVQVIEVYHADRYLLASDGLTDAVEEERLSEIISRTANPQQAAELLTQEAIANGAGDDVTCVVFYVQSDLGDELSASQPPAMWQRLLSLFHPRSG